MNLSDYGVRTRMKRKTIIIIAIVAVVITGIAITAKIVIGSIESNLEELKYLQIDEVDMSTIKDGTYSGEYSALPVSAKVKVTVEGHQIKDIELLEHVNGQGSGAEIIPATVVEKQTLQIDTVSGATYSSTVILKAIENALLNASK